MLDAGTEPFSAIPSPILLSYLLVVPLGLFSSLLLLAALLRAPALRPPHNNAFLLSLAVADLLLLLSCPLTLLQLYSTHWPLPLLPLLCQAVTSLPLLFSLASTFSICLIALERRKVRSY